MFASATSGDRPNNSKFSKCSIGNISNVLDAIEDKKKKNCFTGVLYACINISWNTSLADFIVPFIFVTASAGAFCGNKIVEAGEECDCGYDDNECVDKCCYPRQISDLDKMKNDTAKGCTRKSGTQCRYGSNSWNCICVKYYINWTMNLTCHFYCTVQAKGLVVRASRASSFPSRKTFNARLNRIAVTIRLVTGDPPSVLRRCQEPIRLDVTRELR